MKAFITFIVILAILILGAGVFFFTGRYNVAAISPHWNMTLEILETVRDQSIKRQSRGIQVPQWLDEPGLRQIGFHHYHEMCRLCHGAPGYERKEFARGLYPNPPDLASQNIQNQWNDAQMYWIVKNGLKMTGMPSFGITHSKKQMWAIIVFVRHLPNITPNEYNGMVRSEAKAEK